MIKLQTTKVILSLFPYVSDWAAVSIFADLMISPNALNVVMHARKIESIFVFVCNYSFPKAMYHV